MVATTIPKVRFIHMAVFINAITLLLVTNFCLVTCSVVDMECTNKKSLRKNELILVNSSTVKSIMKGNSWQWGLVADCHITSVLGMQEMMSVVSAVLCPFYVAQNHLK